MGFSCTGPDESPKALVNIFLVDAPAQWDSVVVELQGVEIELVISGREGQIETVFLPYEPGNKQVNVSLLVGGDILPISRREFQIGNITKATLRLGTNNLLYLGERAYPLRLPNGQTDFPGDLSISMEPGISYDIIVDFDLEKSIQVTQSDPLTFSFQPTLDIKSGIGQGTVQGSVSPTTLKPAIYAIRDFDSLSTHMNPSGTYVFRLDPGTYSIYVDPKDASYLPDTLQNIQVREGQRTNAERITLSKK
ncbi:hypothetical protein Aconfl_26900 [Algoriphagus confluentis]|uniref:DUF4382 domain-containing protein n=1 Tax=Algoriphagus confluentis TaxID=1697556 RepID=A0ABQ6PQ60_9BACT|nr:hypothetical protein Aconfl_26900 [Algoriphagus confluentis]